MKLVFDEPKTKINKIFKGEWKRLERLRDKYAVSSDDEINLIRIQKDVI